MICLKGLMPRARIGLSIPGGIGRPLTGVAAGRALCCLSEPALRRPECGVGRWAEGRELLLWLGGGCVRCAVPGAVQFARFAAPDGALSQTLARLRAMSWARRHQAVRPADLWVHGLD